MRSKRFPAVLLVLLLVAGCSGCASTTPQQAESTAVIGYEATGALLTQAHATAATLKAAGKLSPAQVTQFNDVYGKAAQAYKDLGDALVLAVKTTDAATQKTIQANIGTLTVQLAALVTQVSALIQGVK